MPELRILQDGWQWRMDASAHAYLWLTPTTCLELSGEDVLQAVLHQIAGATIAARLLGQMPPRAPVTGLPIPPAPRKPPRRLLGVKDRQLRGYGQGTL